MVALYLWIKYGNAIAGSDHSGRFLRWMTGKLAAIIFVFMGLQHLSENPVGILIYVIPLLFMIIFMNNEIIKVYSDRIVYIPLISLPGSYREFLFDDIETVFQDDKPEHRNHVSILFRKGNITRLTPGWYSSPGYIIDQINKQKQLHEVLKPATRKSSLAINHKL